MKLPGLGRITAHIKISLGLKGRGNRSFIGSCIAGELRQGRQQLAEKLVVRLALESQCLQIPGHLDEGLCIALGTAGSAGRLLSNKATAMLTMLAFLFFSFFD